MSESQNYFVSSRGLLKSCDFFSQTPISSIRSLVNYFDKDFKKIVTMKNPTIYVCGSAIPHFILSLFPRINFPFILVSGDCDETVPNEIFANGNVFESFLNDAKLVHWFCQNMTVIHPKITNMPIGLDYHTMTVNKMWGDITSSADQEKLMKSVIAESKPFWERQIKCYSNFHFSMSTKYGQDRKDAYAQIPSDLVFYEPQHLPRLETWNVQKDYAFVISPHGNGLDCHRTWEALVLGCIPIVKTSKIDILYDDLPVLIVKNWSDVSSDLLKTTIDNFKKMNFNYEKLSLQYWTKKMNDIKTGIYEISSNLLYFDMSHFRIADNWYYNINVNNYRDKPINYMEIGTFHGANLLSVANSYGLHESSKLYCIDPWKDYNEYPEYKNKQTEIYESFLSNVEKSGSKDKIIVCRGYSNLEVPKFEDDFFDIIYIDGNHEPEYVLEDAVLSFRKLKKGGIMIFDDYGWGGPDLTQRGIDGFLNGYNKRIIILGERNTQVFVKKIF